MPELPEVETIRRNLENLTVGSRVLSVSEPTHPRTLRYQNGGIAALRAQLVGSRLRAVVRRGKFLWFPLDTVADSNSPEGQLCLVTHLGMSGQLRVLPSGMPPDAAGLGPGLEAETAETMLRHERLRLTLDNGSNLVFCDQRTFGHVELRPLVPTPDGAPGGKGDPGGLLPQGVEHIARDVMDPYLTYNAVASLRRSGRAIKTKLLDQAVVSGIGNIYADEGLFVAGIHPATPAGNLSRKETQALLEAVRGVMAHALEFGGTSFDRLYVNSWGNPGEFAKELNVYGRGGQSCHRCGTTLAKMVIDGRSSVYCPQCQQKR